MNPVLRLSLAVLLLGCDTKGSSETADGGTVPCSDFALDGGTATWEMTDGPAGAAPVIADPDAPDTTATTEVEGSYTFASGATTVTVEVAYVVQTDEDTEADDGLLSLREAVDAAQQCPGPHTITAAEGLTALASPVAVTDPLGGDNDLTLVAPDGGAALTGDGPLLWPEGVLLTIEGVDITDGWSDSSDGGMIILGEGAALVMRGLSLTDNTNESGLYGGVVTGRFGNAVTLDGVTASGNHASQPGGVVYLTGSLEVRGGTSSTNSSEGCGGVFYVAGDASVSDTTFDQNTGARGGAVCVDGGALSVVGVDFTENISSELGGAVFVDGAGAVADFDGAVFTENLSVSGGALFLGESDALVTGVVFTDNEATGDALSHGGAIASRGGLVVEDSSFTSNLASGADKDGLLSQGGAIALSSLTNTHTLSVARSTFVDNAAEQGGAIAETFAASVQVSEATFSGNQALYGGAASFAPVGHVSFTDTTISGSSASEDGGAIYFQGTTRDYADNTANLFLSDTTVQGNSAGGFGGGVYSLIGDVILAGASVTGNTAQAVSSLPVGGGVCNDGGWVSGAAAVSGNSPDELCDDSRSE